MVEVKIRPIGLRSRPGMVDPSGHTLLVWAVHLWSGHILRHATRQAHGLGPRQFQRTRRLPSRSLDFVPGVVHSFIRAPQSL
jgi:hypothetical protein